MADLVRRLEAEWAWLAHGSQARCALATWSRHEPVLADLCGLDRLRRVVHDRRDPARSDRILAALVRLAAVTGHNDPLAARVVLQLLLPGAIHLREILHAHRGGDPRATEATVLAELMVGIRTYPWQRLPRHIAANLLLDCRQRITRAYRRTRAEIAVGLQVTEPAAGRDEEDPFAVQDLLRWALRRGVLDRFEAALLVASLVHERPMAELVERFGQCRTSLYTDRARALGRLREALAATPRALAVHGEAG